MSTAKETKCLKVLEELKLLDIRKFYGSLQGSSPGPLDAIRFRARSDDLDSFQRLLNGILKQKNLSAEKKLQLVRGAIEYMRDVINEKDKSTGISVGMKVFHNMLTEYEKNLNQKLKENGVQIKSGKDANNTPEANKMALIWHVQEQEREHKATFKDNYKDKNFMPNLRKVDVTQTRVASVHEEHSTRFSAVATELGLLQDVRNKVLPQSEVFNPEAPSIMPEPGETPIAPKPPEIPAPPSETPAPPAPETPAPPSRPEAFEIEAGPQPKSPIQTLKALVTRKRPNKR